MNGLAIGSCFVEHIGGWLRAVKFNLLLNPFGIVYNPISICRQLNLLLKENVYPLDQLFQHNELWHTFDHHSQFSGIDKATVLTNINNAFSKSKTQLKQADYLIVTFGTAHVYSLKNENHIVSNCHKIPNTNFDKQRLSVKEIMNAWTPLIETLKKTSPDLKILLTVSPVRHLKDGVIDNQRSKAILLLAIDNLVQQYDNCFYFPAYEIMMDDLRDYRFYAKDMIHPSDVAIDYIKEKFAATFLNVDSQLIVRKIEEIQSAVGHQPFQPNAIAHQDFLKKTREKMNALEQEFGIDFKEERLVIG